MCSAALQTSIIKSASITRRLTGYLLPVLYNEHEVQRSVDLLILRTKRTLMITERVLTRTHVPQPIVQSNPSNYNPALPRESITLHNLLSQKPEPTQNFIRDKAIPITRMYPGCVLCEPYSGLQCPEIIHSRTFVQIRLREFATIR